MLRVHCSGGIANAEALSMSMIFDGLKGFRTVQSRKNLFQEQEEVLWNVFCPLMVEIIRDL